MSIVKIAEKAGVGIGTVSRYINDRSKVSLEAARRIAKAIEDSGYHPRVRRPGPKTRERAGIKTGVVLFLVMGMQDPEKMLHMPAFSLLLTGIQRALMAHGINLMFASYSDSSGVPEMLDEKYCDGVIMQSYGMKNIPDKLLKKLRGIPAVWCFREHCDYNNEFDHVFYNNAAVGFMAARYMHERGHKNVAFIRTNSKHEVFCQRGERFYGACESLGLKVLNVISSLDADSLIADHSVDIATQFLSCSKEITGVFFCSDDAMLGVYNELRANGFDMNKLDMLGCNNEEQFLAHIRPRPATIDIRLTEMGEQAVARLLARVNGIETGPVMELLINPQLVAGDKQ